MKKTINKIEVHFNKVSYDKAAELYEKKLSTKKYITYEAKRLLKSDADLKSLFYERPLSSFYLAVAAAFENPMNLSGEKLIMLHEIDISHFKQLCEEWEQLKEFKKPIKSDYTMYASTQEQINRYHSAKKLITVLNETAKYLPYRSPLQLVQPFHPILKLDGNSNLIVSPAFIAS
tara:strand:+ start:2877 stop:3401 length:525 start_codon:yes stop_codon:yes gene_type:complete